MPTWTQVLTKHRHTIQLNARVYNRFNYWYYPTFAWGTQAENWNSTRSQTTLETTWFDSWNPQLVVPYDMTIKSYFVYGNSTATHDIEFALLKGAGVTWDNTNADNFTLTQIGATQSGSWTSGRYNKLGQSNPLNAFGNPLTVSEGDMLMPSFRRSSGSTSATYSYLEICLVIIGEET